MQAVEGHGAVDAHADIRPAGRPFEAHAALFAVRIGQIAAPVVGAHQVIGGEAVVVHVLIGIGRGEAIEHQARGTQRAVVIDQTLLRRVQGRIGGLGGLDPIGAFLGHLADGRDLFDHGIDGGRFLAGQVAGARFASAVQRDEIEGQGVAVAVDAERQVRVIGIAEQRSGIEHRLGDRTGDPGDRHLPAAVAVSLQAQADALAGQRRRFERVGPSDLIGDHRTGDAGVVRIRRPVHRHILDRALLRIQHDRHRSKLITVGRVELRIALVGHVGEIERHTAAGGHVVIEQFQMCAVELEGLIDAHADVRPGALPLKVHAAARIRGRGEEARALPVVVAEQVVHPDGVIVHIRRGGQQGVGALRRRQDVEVIHQRLFVVVQRVIRRACRADLLAAVGRHRADVRDQLLDRVDRRLIDDRAGGRFLGEGHVLERVVLQPPAAEADGAVGDGVGIVPFDDLDVIDIDRHFFRLGHDLEPIVGVGLDLLRAGHAADVRPIILGQTHLLEIEPNGQPLALIEPRAFADRQTHLSGGNIAEIDGICVGIGLVRVQRDPGIRREMVVRAHGVADRDHAVLDRVVGIQLTGEVGKQVHFFRLGRLLLGEGHVFERIVLQPPAAEADGAVGDGVGIVPFDDLDVIDIDRHFFRLGHDLEPIVGVGLDLLRAGHAADVRPIILGQTHLLEIEPNGQPLALIEPRAFADRQTHLSGGNIAEIDGICVGIGLVRVQRDPGIRREMVVRAHGVADRDHAVLDRVVGIQLAGEVG